MTQFSIKKPFMAVSILSLSVLSMGLVGCSEDSEESNKAVEQVSVNNTMDVKQPAADTAPKEALVSDSLPQEVKQDTMVEAQVEEKVEAKPVAKVAETKPVEKVVAVKEAPKPVVTSNGKELFQTCIGCHGDTAGGGIGPRLNNQEPAEIVKKLKMYKAGEQRGAMTAMMLPIAEGMSENDMQAIAEYVVTLK